MWVVLVNLSVVPFLTFPLFWLMFLGFDRESGVCEELIIFSLSPEIVSLEFLLNLHT